jgi:hypothetical protein
MYSLLLCSLLSDGELLGGSAGGVLWRICALYGTSACLIGAGTVNVVFGLNDMGTLGQTVEVVVRDVIARSAVVSPVVTAELADGLQACSTLVADLHEVVVAFSLNSDASASKWMAKVDSINFTNTLTTWGKDKYKVFGIYITTDNPDELTDEKTEAKEWVNCYISLDGRGEYPDASGSGRISGRGNSTLEWHPNGLFTFGCYLVLVPLFYYLTKKLRKLPQ